MATTTSNGGGVSGKTVDRAALRTGRELIRRLRGVTAESLLEFLTERQYVTPREGVGSVLDLAGERLGVCPVAAARAMDWLDIDPAHALGRLRRTELTQLSRCLHRFTKQAQKGQTPRVCKLK